MSDIIQWASDTAIGNRDLNEDARRMAAFTKDGLYLLPKNGTWDLANGDLFFAVSDGMGGALHGERASRLGLDSFFEKLSRTHLETFTDTDHPSTADIMHLLDDLIQKAHSVVNHEAVNYAECEGMGATLTVLWLRANHESWLVHAGDSRLYSLTSEDDLKQISHDHTHAGFLYRRGKINEREQRSHPASHALTQALGGRIQYLYPQIERFEHKSDTRYLLCTDGILEGLWNKHISELMSVDEFKSEEVMNQLLEKSLKDGGNDNSTLICVGPGQS